MVTYFNRQISLIKQRCVGSELRLKATKNIIWLIVDRLYQIGISFFIGVWVARYLGPEKFGALNYAFAFIALLSPLSVLGMDNIIVREMVKRNVADQVIISTSLVIRLLSSIFTYVVVIGSVLVFFRNNNSKQFLILIAGLLLFANILDVFDYWFKAQVLSKYIVYARSISTIIVSLFKVIAIITLQDVFVFSLIMVSGAFLYGFGNMIFYFFNKKYLNFNFKPSLQYAKLILKDSWPLMLSSISIILYMKIDQIMLGSMVNDIELGKYSAAARLTEGFYFIPTILSATLLPIVVKSRELPEKLYVLRIKKYFQFNTIIALTISFSSLFWSGFAFDLLYGRDYNGASAVFVIHIWACIFVFLGVARSNVMLVENKNLFTLYTTLAGAITNIILNLILIPFLGGIGAAIATVFSFGMAAYLSAAFFRETRGLFKLMTESMLYYLIFPVYLFKLIRKRG